MKLHRFAAVTAATLILTACGADKVPEETPATDATVTTEQIPALASLDQRLSYIVGENMARQFTSDGITLDTDTLALAVADVVEGKESRLSEEDKRNTIQEIQTRAQETQKAESDALAAANTEAGAAYLAANAEKEGVVTTESGLQYKEVVAGDGEETPTANDGVTVNYKGTLIDGTVFDSSYDRGQPASFPVNGVIPGWIEALQLMNVGDKFELTIPSDLAYGSGGTGPVIGPNATLVFEVELLEIARAEQPGEVTAQ
ncbi:MAG: FKBP-type peptidyl-prolyl cis-trans isomerase FklB [Granulosicoccus sp.]|jgi:FKBP-type peptidyl-prolyl cis-trans isomerase FklB